MFFKMFVIVFALVIFAVATPASAEKGTADRESSRYETTIKKALRVCVLHKELKPCDKANKGITVIMKWRVASKEASIWEMAAYNAGITGMQVIASNAREIAIKKREVSNNYKQLSESYFVWARRYLRTKGSKISNR